MDFDFSDDQEQFRAAVRRWVERSYGFERRSAIARSGGFSRDAYRELAELGLCAMLIPQASGGIGMGPVESMVAMEELGRGIVLEPLGEALIAGVVLASYAPDNLNSAWLPRIGSGETIAVLAYQERAARYRLEVCAATAIARDGAWAVTGAKSIVSVGDHADLFIVPATISGIIGLFAVRRQAAGVATRGYGTLDGGRAAEVIFDNAAAELITTDGLAALAHAIDIGIAGICAQAVGTMEKMLEITVEYINTRKQFGVAISSFQAVRHRIADMKMHLELARSMSYYASLKLDSATEERRAAMARAKYQIGVSMRFVGQQAIQLHGGIGVTDECSVSHYFKRLTQIELAFGDTLHQLGEVANRMQDHAGVFT